MIKAHTKNSKVAKNIYSTHLSPSEMFQSELIRSLLLRWMRETFFKVEINDKWDSHRLIHWILWTRKKKCVFDALNKWMKNEDNRVFLNFEVCVSISMKCIMLNEEWESQFFHVRHTISIDFNSDEMNFYCFLYASLAILRKQRQQRVNSLMFCNKNSSFPYGVIYPSYGFKCHSCSCVSVFIVSSPIHSPLSLST